MRSITRIWKPLKEKESAHFYRHKVTDMSEEADACYPYPIQIQRNPHNHFLPREFLVKNTLSDKEFETLRSIVADIPEIKLGILIHSNRYSLSIEANSQEAFMAALLRFDLRLRKFGMREKITLRE